MPADLFSDDAKLSAIPIADGVLYFAAHLPLPFSNQEILTQLISTMPWRTESIQVWGKLHPQPRLTAWYGDPGTGYSYSGIALQPLPWTPLLQTIRHAVEQLSGHRFNSVLLNYYRDQHDSMGMHSDDEAELGENPVIASLSFGATRRFILKHKTRHDLPRRVIDLADGNLLLMAGSLQQHWLHGIHKLASHCGPRVNLTFRQIIMVHQQPGLPRNFPPP